MNELNSIPLTQLKGASKEAISKGHAEYVLKDGGPSVEFRWKEK